MTNITKPTTKRTDGPSKKLSKRSVVHNVLEAARPRGEISDHSELYSNWWICHRDLPQLGENERTLFRKIINEAYHRGDCFCYFGHWVCQRIDEPEEQPGRARQPESGRKNFERGVHQMEHRPDLQTV